MPFPSNPANNQVIVSKGIRYSYNSDRNSWTRESPLDLTTAVNLAVNNSTTVTSLTNSINSVDGRVDQLSQDLTIYDTIPLMLAAQGQQATGSLYRAANNLFRKLATTTAAITDYAFLGTTVYGTRAQFDNDDFSASYFENLQLLLTDDLLTYYSNGTEWLNVTGAARTQFTRLVSSSESLPTTDGYYIFKSERTETQITNLGITPHQGDMFRLDSGTWSHYGAYEAINPSLTDGNSITVMKIGTRQWSSQLQSTGNLVLRVQTLNDLTDDARNSSPGHIYVEEENEFYYWSPTNDQSIANGFKPWFPSAVNSVEDFQALAVGDYFTIDGNTSGLLSPDSSLSSVTAFRASSHASSTSAINDTSITATWNSAGINGDNVVASVTSSSSYNVNNDPYPLVNAFVNSAASWVVGANQPTGTITIDFSNTVAAAVWCFKFKGRDSFAEWFRSHDVTFTYWDGTVERFYARNDRNNDLTLIFYPNIRKRIRSISTFFSEEESINPGANNFQIGFITGSLLAKNGSYRKTGTATTDFEEAPNFMVTTGTRSIKRYANAAQMLSDQTTLSHFDGGLYRVGTGNQVKYYEFLGNATGNIVTDYAPIGGPETIVSNTAPTTRGDQSPLTVGDFWINNDDANGFALVNVRASDANGVQYWSGIG